MSDSSNNQSPSSSNSSGNVKDNGPISSTGQSKDSSSSTSSSGGGEASSPSSRYARQEITLVGWDDCNACAVADKAFNEKVIPNSSIPTTYNKYTPDSQEGRSIVAEKKLETVPYIRRCFIPKEGEERVCDEYTEFRESDYQLK